MPTKMISLFTMLSRSTTSLAILIMYLLKVGDCNLSHLRLDLSIPQILAKHKKHFMEVCKKGEELAVNLFISEQNIYNLAVKLAIENHTHD